MRWFILPIFIAFTGCNSNSMVMPKTLDTKEITKKPISIKVYDGNQEYSVTPEQDRFTIPQTTIKVTEGLNSLVAISKNGYLPSFKLHKKSENGSLEIVKLD